jgi:hypothetical protein
MSELHCTTQKYPSRFHRWGHMQPKKSPSFALGASQCRSRCCRDARHPWWSLCPFGPYRTLSDFWCHDGSLVVLVCSFVCALLFWYLRVTWCPICSESPSVISWDEGFKFVMDHGACPSDSALNLRLTYLSLWWWLDYRQFISPLFTDKTVQVISAPYTVHLLPGLRWTCSHTASSPFITTGRLPWL